MSTSVKAFSPFWTQQNGLNALIVDRNLAAIKTALDAANGEIINIRNDITRLFSTVNVNLSIPGGQPGPPGMDAPASDGDGGGTGGPSTSTLMARLWISTPDPSVPNGVNMGALGAGTLQQTVTAGVATPTAFAGTTGSVPFYAAGNQLAQDNANLFWNASTLRFGIGTSSPAQMLHVNRDQDNLTAFEVSNANAGVNVYTGYFVSNALVPAAASGYLVMDLYGTGTNFGDGEMPRTAHLRLHNTSGAPLVIGTDTLAGPIRFRVAGLTPGNDDVVFNTSGAVDITNLGASGVVYATITSGRLKIGTSAEVAAAITWPASARVLYSTGTTTAPAGRAGFEFDTGDDQVWMSSSIEQGWYNVGDPTVANYERVLARWTGNVWNLASEAAGSGTVRAIKVASTAGVTVDSFLQINGVTASTNDALTVGHTTNADRDHVRIYLGGGAGQDTASNYLLDIIPSNTAIGTGNNGGILATARIGTLTYTGTGSPTPAETISLYVAGAPVQSGFGVVGVPLAVYVASGRTRLDGDFYVNQTASLVINNNGGYFDFDYGMTNAIGTTATTGYFFITSCAGVPTGVPAATGRTNTLAIQYDRTNNKLYVYNGAWKGVTLT